jgi:hypothetical protein
MAYQGKKLKRRKPQKERGFINDKSFSHLAVNGLWGQDEAGSGTKSE